jgi:Flp pilus assembly protein TadB
MEKPKKVCNDLRERLKNMEREKRNRIIFVVVYCIVAGIVTSEFFIIGFSIWLFTAFIFVWALLAIYNAREAKLNKDKEELGCEN